MQAYELQGPVGQGQFGIVYKARHRGDGTIVCIKRIPMAAKEDQTATLKEAQLLSSLDHPNIIRYKECFIDDEGALCIVTSFCEEGDLFRRIRDKAKKNELFAENEVMDMFIQIASALMYIHGKKILHRDLKTQNIFQARGGIMVLGDFGISKVLEKTDQFATTVTGTPYYMAPEICSSQPYTFKSDIWSLGCVLYELCTLKHAFAADSLLSLVYQIVRGNFPPIPKDMFSPGLSELVNSLLVRDPNSRPSLQQVFQMPYVQQHLQRYKQEEGRRYVKQSTMARRKQLMEQTMDQAASLKLDADFQNLTPKQQAARRRELQQQKRELELKVATMNNQQDRKQIEERKKRMVHESSVLPGTRASVMMSPRNGDESPYAAARPRGTLSSLDESLVNFGTLPSSSQYAGPPDMMGAGTLGRGATGAGDTVLMGSVMVTQTGKKMTGTAGGPSPASTTGAARGASRGTGAGTGRFDATDGMVNMGSVGYKVGGTTSGTSAGTPRSSQQAPAVDHGFRFGTPPAGSTREKAAARREGPATSTQSLPQSPATPHAGPSRAGPRFHSPEASQLSKVAPQPLHGNGYKSDHDDYESDFEDYNGDDDGQQMADHRMKLLSNVEELERTVLSAQPQPGQIALVEEKVTSTVKSSKAQALRDRCAAGLGRHFDEVYAYLRRVRTSAQPQAETEVQRRLMELVGGKKELMQGCFMVDQLVFQESMCK